MRTEENGSGFFMRVKGIFSAPDTDTAVQELDETPVTSTTTEHPFAYLRQARMEVHTEYPTRELLVKTTEVSAPKISLPEEKDLDVKFAQSFIAQDGKFIYCSTMKEVVGYLKAMKEEFGWQHVFCWENEIKDAFCDHQFQKGAVGFSLETSDAAVSLCDSLIASDGTILLNSTQASRRTLSCFPKTHVLIADMTRLSATEESALERFKKRNKGELPSLIKLGNCSNGHFYDKARLILNAEGTEDIYVILVDEIIPPSLRP